jgi:ppGpp synthetase/RelA/SpoT-type nucleotidyltranferase
VTDQKTIKDRLREQYFELLPDIRRVTEHLEAVVRYSVLPIVNKLDNFERVVVTSRIKECESAIDSLRRRQEGGTFNPDQRSLYTLTDLKDLAGVRVLAFPRRRVTEIDQELRKRFESWQSDPIPGLDQGDQPRASKYYGYCREASTKVRGEYQVASMLIGLFMEAEHSPIYKPPPELKGAAGNQEMKQRRKEVYDSLRAFDEEFDALIPKPSSGAKD